MENFSDNSNFDEKNEEPISRPSHLSPSSPSLPSELRGLYGALPEPAQRLFNRAFTKLWYKVLDSRKFTRYGGVLSVYWTVMILRRKHNITENELAVLSLLNILTEQGKLTINSIEFMKVYSDIILQHDTFRKVISALKRHGWIERFNHDPAQPYLQRGVCNNPVFIRMSPAGMTLIKQIERDMNWEILNTIRLNVTTTGK